MEEQFLFTDEARNGSGPHVPNVQDAGHPTLEGGTDRPKPGGSEYQQDRKVRNTDRFGNRQGAWFAYDDPAIGDSEFEATPLVPVKAILKEHGLPAWAEVFHHAFTMLLERRRQVRDVRLSEEERLAESIEFAKAENLKIDAEVAALKEKRDMALSEETARLAALDAPLAEAHALAAEAVSKTGNLYDPSDLSERSVLRARPITLEMAAKTLGLPFSPTDHTVFMGVWIGWLCTFAVGAILGASIAFITHFGGVRPDTVGRHLPLMFLLTAVGFAVATALKYAVRFLWYLAGGYRYQENGTGRWLGALLVALVGTALVVLSDMAAERLGILAVVRSNQAMDGLRLRGVHQAEQPGFEGLVYWAVALLFMAGLAISAAVEGYLRGRANEVGARLRAKQEADLRAADAAERATPVVQEALHRIGIVLNILDQKRQVANRLKETTDQVDATIAALEAKPLPERQDLSDQAERRIQDARDNFQGAQREFMRLLYALLAVVEPLRLKYHKMVRPPVGADPLGNQGNRERRRRW